MGGKITFPLLPVYHATKFAVEGFSESFRHEVAPLGIKIKLIEPGSIISDFGSRSLDWQQDEKLTEYAPFAEKVQAAFSKFFKPQRTELVAETIYKAATDPSDQLRYIAGQDAEQLLKARDEMKDDKFFDFMQKTARIVKNFIV